MRYTIDSELKQRFLDAVLKTEEVGTGRDKEPSAGLPEVHVSELITSVVNSWFKRHGHKEVFSDRSRESMAAGVGMQGALNLPFLRTEVEVRDTLVGPDGEFATLVGHVDGVEDWQRDYGRNLGIPWELKTTAYGYNQTTSAHYFEQLGTYAHMLGSTKGRLVTFHRSSQAGLFKVGTVEWDEDELESWWFEITRRAYLLVTSLEPPWGEEYKWMEGYYQLPAGVVRERSGTYLGWFGEPL